MDEKKEKLEGVDILGHVLCSYYGKSLLQNGKNYYIVNRYITPGEDVFFNLNEAIPMPSYLFALAAMQEEDLTDALKFIRKNWFED